MANTTDFISTVYDELARLVGVRSSQASTFMLMAWPGYALNPSDFRRSDAPNGPYDPDVAREAVSWLANIAPRFNRARFEDSGFQVDDLYEILVTSAIPMGATEASFATNPIYRLFSDAMFELTQAKRPSHDDPNDFYYPCAATPSRWYDENVPQGWTTITLNQSDIKPATPKSPFVRAVPSDAAGASVWRLKPTAAEGRAVKERLQQAVARKSSASSGAAPSAAGAARAPRSTAFPMAVTGRATDFPIATADRATTRPKAIPASRTLDSPNLPTASFVTASSRPASPPVSGRTVVTDPATAKLLFERSRSPSNAFRGKLKVDDLNIPQLDFGHASLRKRLLIKPVIDGALPPRPASPATSGFKVSFKYCRVNIERPWLKLALLNTKNWWMFDTRDGEYSTGASDSNAGIFPLLSTSFIAIRDLQITASWQREDRTNLRNAASFGFFDLSGATVSNDTLQVKGLQVIAWICNVMPKLPPFPPPT